MMNPFVADKCCDQPWFRSGMLLVVSLAVLFTAGCGNDGEQSNTSAETASSENASLDQKISGLISKMEFTREEYGESFDNGDVVDNAEYQEALQMGIQGAQSQFKKLHSKLAERNEGLADQVGTNLDELLKLIKNKEATSDVNTRVGSTIDLLKSLRGSSGNSLTATYRKQVSERDTMLHAERQSGSYRIGVFAKTSRTTFGPDGSANEPPSDSFYLGVTLREKRTKRYLPGSTVKVTLGDQTATLTETWGDFHHYGTHLSGSVDRDAEIKVSVSPPAYGRHAGMKSVHLEPASVTFPVQNADLEDHPVFAGPDPASHSSDYEIGSGIKTALAESNEAKTAGSYRVAFIVEGAEPFWTWSDGELNARTGDGDHQNHLEIVLLDKETNEPLPHADITLELNAGDTDQTIELYPLLAEFYHYGTNAPVSPGNTYKVTAHIRAPDLRTFEQGRFSHETVTFQWTKSE